MNFDHGLVSFMSSFPSVSYAFSASSFSGLSNLFLFCGIMGETLALKNMAGRILCSNNLSLDIFIGW